MPTTSSRNWLPLLVLAACSGPGAVAPAPAPAPVGSASAPAPTPVPPPPTPAGTKVTLADVGLDAGALDRSTEPCTDFYQFACGGWLAQNPIPADRARWGRFAEIEERNLASLTTLLAEAASSTSGGDPSSKQLGDFYAACMDEAAVEKAGLAALRPLLAKTRTVKDARSWLAALVELHKLGRWVVWQSSAMPDLKASLTHVLYLDAAGLALPDRDYYLESGLEPARTAYRDHVGRMLALAGVPAARTAAAAADVVAIETELAKLHRTAEANRDVASRYNPTEARTLGKRTKSVDWGAYWKGLGITPTRQVVLATPELFDRLDSVRARWKPAQWSSYFTYHLVSHFAFALPQAFEQEAFTLQRALTGVEQQPDRTKRCIGATQGSLGEALGARFVARHFPPAHRQTAITMFDAVVQAMGAEIGTLTWMSEATRARGAAKLGKLVKMVGYPDTWRTYDFVVKRDDFAGNAVRARAFETHRNLKKLGKPVDRAEWQMNAYDVNAYYDPSANNTAMPAGILQPPFFGQDRSVAANLGGIGMVIGHELTHGFDDQGARFDGDGNLQNWWLPADASAFAERGRCVADQYATFEAMPKGFVNGKLTLGENLADLGGVKMAFRAYRTLREDAARPYVADGFTEDQQFFIAVAQAWCSHDRPAEIQRRLTVDPHAPPKFRVYGALRNLPAFAEAFRCSPGTPMSPAKTCSVW